MGLSCQVRSRPGYETKLMSNVFRAQLLQMARTCIANNSRSVSCRRIQTRRSWRHLKVLISPCGAVLVVFCTHSSRYHHTVPIRGPGQLPRRERWRGERRGSRIWTFCCTGGLRGSEILMTPVSCRGRYIDGAQESLAGSRITDEQLECPANTRADGAERRRERSVAEADMVGYGSWDCDSADQQPLLATAEACATSCFALSVSVQVRASRDDVSLHFSVDLGSSDAGQESSQGSYSKHEWRMCQQPDTGKGVIWTGRSSRALQRRMLVPHTWHWSESLKVVCHK